MAENQQAERRGRKWRNIIIYIFCAAFIAGVATSIALRAYLASPQAAARISRTLSGYLHQEVTVARLGTSGRAVQVHGLTLANPPGFPAGKILSVDTLTVSPSWSDFLSGRQRFRLLSLSGVRLQLLRNSKGEWNYAQLQRAFGGKKPAAKETLVEKVSVRDAAVSVNGEEVRGISLDLFNVSSKGSSDSGVDLALEDAWRNRYTLKGHARGGTAPDVDLSLAGDLHSFAVFTHFLKGKNANLLNGGSGKLLVHALWRQGQLATRGTLAFSSVKLSYGGSGIPLNGTLAFAGGYDQKTDAARLNAVDLALTDLARLHGSGSVQEVRTARRFAAELNLDQTDLARLLAVLPKHEGRMRVAGRLSASGIRLSGSGARGLTDASGTVTLKQAFLEHDRRSILSGIDGSVRLAKTAEGILAKGRLTGRDPQGKALVQAIDAPFETLLSPRLKPLRGRAALNAARMADTDFQGEVGFLAGAAEPYRFALKAPAAQLPAFNPFLERYRLTFSTGSANVTVDGTARSGNDFAAAVQANLSQVQGVREGKALALRAGTWNGRLERKGGHLSSEGTLQAGGGSYGATVADAAFAYHLKDDAVVLEKGTVKAWGTAVTFARLNGRLPRAVQGQTGLPLNFDVEGAEVRRDALQLRGVTGSLRGQYRSDGRGGWVEGSATLGTTAFLWQGKELGAPRARLTLARSEVRGPLEGSLFGGALKGDVSFDPAAPQDARFTLTVSQARLAALAQFFPQQKGSPSLTQGTFDATCSGTYTRSAGLNCRLQGTAAGVVVRGAGSKNLLSDGGLTLSATVAGQRVAVAEAVLSTGPVVKLRVRGDLEQAFSEKRSGSFLLSLPRTPLNDLIDPFVNQLPGMVQEANVAGDVAAEGKLDLRDGRKQLDGTVDLGDLRFEVPSQKLTVAGVKGTVPISLDFSGAAPAKGPPSLIVSRDNYPKLLEQVRQLASGKPSVTAAKVTFGTLELGGLSLQLAAQKGITEIKSLKSTLYGGALFGKGVISMQKGGRFRGDLFLNDVSLKELCRNIPGITGYISGKVDGFISINSEGGGMKGVTGFTDLWARKGKGEKMVVSKQFLQRLSGEKLRGLIFAARPYDRAEIRAILEDGDLTFQALDIEHTNLLGVRDLGVAIAPSQNRISLDHLFNSIKEAATRGKVATGEAPAGAPATEAPAEQPEFKWAE